MQVDKPVRIAVLHFAHETVTFLDNDTTLDDFIYEGSPAKGEALLNSYPREYIGGFVKCAREFSGVTLVGVQSPLFPKTGIGSGWVTNEAFEHFSAMILADLRAQGPFDGVYMSLHGAMAVRGVAHPEAELAARVRKVVGPHVVIAATFDPHGNEDEKFLQSADLAFCVKFYPHYDNYLQGERAARTLIRALRGDYSRSVATRNVPIISPTVLQWTGASPWMDLINRALIWEAREPDVFVNVFFGFPWSDVPDVGLHIQAITNGKPDLAERIVKDMAESAWRNREALLNSAKIYDIAEAVDLAAADAASGRRPVVLADHSDRSGAATWILKEIIARRLRRTLIASVMDGKLIASLMTSARIGDAFDHEVGGRVDASAGQPVRITGEITGMGQANDGTGSRSDWISVAFGDGNVLVISAHYMQVIETTMLEAMGFALGDFDIFVLKSRVHFRRGFHDSGFAPRIYLVEPPEPFLGTVRLDGLPYENVRLTDFYPYGEPEFEA
ncbi:M81 family metallopeptidase [Terrarubrum flagellatum]|uniref:M81 family metallopeptidase n=1 Tax=Terrirubrum flagellatum TaxID=2895980 RepID=UPI0031456A5E